MVAKHYDPLFRPVSSIWHNWSLLETLSRGFLERPLLGFVLLRWPLLLFISLSLNVGESRDQPSAAWMSFLLYPHSVLRPVAAKHKASGQTVHKLYNVGIEFKI